MATEEDKKNNIPLNRDDRQILDDNKHLLTGMIMLFYQMGCQKVLELPFTHNGEKFKVRVEKEN